MTDWPEIAAWQRARAAHAHEAIATVQNQLAAVRAENSNLQQREAQYQAELVELRSHIECQLACKLPAF
jgi:uncharacterized protein YigA (DUF484 family)